eukprot:gene8066-5618_t
MSLSRLSSVIIIIISMFLLIAAVHLQWARETQGRIFIFFLGFFRRKMIKIYEDHFWRSHLAIIIISQDSFPLLSLGFGEYNIISSSIISFYSTKTQYLQQKISFIIYKKKEEDEKKEYYEIFKWTKTKYLWRPGVTVSSPIVVGSSNGLQFFVAAWRGGEPRGGLLRTGRFELSFTSKPASYIFEVEIDAFFEGF